jgi:putative endonuclease
VYTVYILKNFKNHLYIGCTANLNQRLIRHNAGDGAEFTKRNKDFELVYQEIYPTLLEAHRREKQIKGWTREKKEALINGDKELLKNLSKKKI